MADEIEDRPASAAPALGGRQKRAFLLAAVLVLGAGIAIKLLGKSSTASAPGTPDTSGLEAPVPVSVYNSYYTTGGTPSAPGSTGGSTGGGTTGGGTTGGSGGHGILPIRPRNPIDPLGGGSNGLIRTGGGLGPGGFHGRNPGDPLGGGPNGLIRPPVVHTRNPVDPPTAVPMIAPLPAGSDPAHYHLAIG